MNAAEAHDTYLMWRKDWLARASASGISQMQIYAWFLEEYGLSGKPDKAVCPLCEAGRVLRKHGVILPPDAPGAGSLHAFWHSLL